MDTPRNSQPNPSLPRKMVFSPTQQTQSLAVARSSCNRRCTLRPLRRFTRQNRSPVPSQDGEAPLSLPLRTPRSRFGSPLALLRPISARPLASLVPTRGLNCYSENGHEAGNNYYSNYVVEEEQEDYYYDDEEENNQFSKSRSINNILRRPSAVNRFSGFLSGGEGKD
ncbi:hypothetical protein PVK06_038635 [Gossypium arboreum]|uniref:Uncharacterized protein n=1 Tax=Gossypium arboreum TaxID=29729 RepID=A0ABR0N0M4_GOSAR|nr:hypothetical protein PVK06_038635 [Gossypium arboreum]